MNEENIRSLLRSLPREGASEGFTERVMSRLDEAPRHAYHQPRFALAAGLALIVAAWFGFRQWQSSVEEQQTNARIQSIKSEVEQLQSDIRLLRNLAPVLYLGGNEDVDFVLDLRQLARQAEAESSKPTSFEQGDERLGKGKVYNE